MGFPAKILWLTLWTVCVAQDCKESPPRQPTEILTGSWSAEMYPQGTKAMYKCRPGYRTYGIITRECRGGEWVALNPSKICQKKPCGHPGDTPFGSFELEEGDKFEYGAKVVYTCNPGYQMIGEVNFRECEADGWTNDIPLCEVVKCLPVTEPANGRIISSAYEQDQEYDFGQVIKFECNAGFMLDGPKEIHCSTNGLWSGERPNCVEISCKIPNIPHGEPTTFKNSYKEKERLQFRCFPGYGYVDRAEAVCTQFGWNPPPACKEVTCDPPRFANGGYTPDVAKYRLGQVITYHCKNGFYPSTRGNTAKCTEIGWEPPPRCSFKPCEFPEIEHGELDRADRYRPYFPVMAGQWYYYTCHRNYVTDSQDYWGVLRCTTKGWSPKVPCRRKCVFNYLRNGHSPRGERSYLQGQSIRVDCHPGYSLPNQQSTMTCTENGWNPPPECFRVETCLKSDVRIKNGFLAESDDIYPLHKETQYRCKQGYITEDGQMSGSITCQRGGWSAQPKCIKSCGVPVFENARAKAGRTWYKVNDRLEYECQDGYKNEAGHTTGVIECGDNGWSGAPTCREVTCDPPRFANGGYTPDVAKYRLGQVITYHCKNGFYPSTRGNTANCTEIGWEPPPRCSFKPCEFPEIEHGELDRADRYRPYFPVMAGQWYYYTCHRNYVTDSQDYWGVLTCTPKGWSPEVPCRRKCVFNYLRNGHSPRGERSYLQGESIKVDCHPGYSLPNQQSTMTCTENGWNPPPECFRVETCIKSDVRIENGFLAESEDLYPLHKEIQYRCKQGYVTEDGQMSGSITCQRSGWSAQPKCIKYCGMPVFENARAKAGRTWYKVNDRLEYECQDGYKNEAGHTTGVIECGDNGWSGAPTCREKECIIPDIEQNLIVQNPLEIYRVGDVMKFTCRNREKIVGPDSIQCYNFGWSPNLPTCKAAVKPCGPQLQLPNGNAIDTPKEGYEHGEVVEYTCNSRFLMKGSRKIQCVDGEWTALPRCIEESSTCSDIPEIDHGYAISHDPPFHHGESVEFNCIEEFTVIGHRSIKCIKGRWTALPQCIETRKLKRCKLSRATTQEINLPHRSDYDHNVKINYSCRGKSEQKRSICMNGRWDPEVTCAEVPKCPPPPQIPKSQNMATTLNYLEGERISIFCQENALIQGAEDIVCHKGTWQSIPRCVEKTPCSQPPHIEHGTIISSRSSEKAFEPQLYAHGTKLNYICEDGFRLSEADGITCHLGEWSSPPQCVGLPCDSPPPSINNGQIPKGPKSYQHGAEVTYRCAGGYGIHGPASVKCLGGKWSHPPECIKAFCSEPPSFNNAVLQQAKKKLYASGEQVTYTCSQYYQMDGSNYVQCVNGRWIGILTCRDVSCGSPPTVENAIIRNEKPRYVSGETVYYECTKSLDRYGEAVVTCFNGNWSKPPECRGADPQLLADKVTAGEDPKLLADKVTAEEDQKLLIDKVTAEKTNGCRVTKSLQ
ncbi:complement factor H-like isoform X2 [Saccopteryx bilineata]|uniref:complement factor H-like isoform X2 n=1 Tax=Saccopteryx bilineata TaxID=59482 RepID=UPI00338F4921